MLEDKKIFTRRLWAEINMNAIEHNFIQVKKAIGDTKLCCVVKADAYGHGAVELAKTYHALGADFFAVSNLDEALELRQAGIEDPMLILGYTPCDRCEDLFEYNISQTVYSLDYAHKLSLECIKRNVTVKIHIKLDTGMSRIGFMCQDVLKNNSSIEEIKLACSQKNLYNEGVFTHFAVADEGENGREYTNKQFKNFSYTIDQLKKAGIEFDICHCSNSGAISDYSSMHFDMVRAGIILYGYQPSDKVKNRLDLIPAMRLKTLISHVKKVKKGTTVSYGRTFEAQRDMVLATVPVGYADGYIRSYAKDGYMLVWDKTCKIGYKAKIVGRICMDQLMLDVTDFDKAEVGNIVVVFGAGTDGEPTADDIAKWGDTISYEVLCAVSKRVPRLYRKNWDKSYNVVYKI